MPLPEKDEMFNSKNRMLQSIEVALGGRIAEELVFHDVTTGASEDIRRATEIAKSMVMKYGMSEKVGMVNYGSEGDEIFIGRDFGQTKSYGEHMATIIDEEVKRIIDECYARAREIITARRDILDKCCALLIEKEKIGQDEFEALFAA
jgi:cell division protease FtsH